MQKQLKPWIQKSTIISAWHEYKNKSGLKIRNFVYDLHDIHIITHDTSYTIIFDKEIDLYEGLPKTLKKNPDSLHFGYTTDPYISWAGDWGHLGAFRMEIICADITNIETKDNKTIIKCLAYKRKLFMPNRVLQ